MKVTRYTILIIVLLLAITIAGKPSVDVVKKAAAEQVLTALDREIGGVAGLGRRTGLYAEQERRMAEMGVVVEDHLFWNKASYTFRDQKRVVGHGYLFSYHPSGSAPFITEPLGPTP